MTSTQEQYGDLIIAMVQNLATYCNLHAERFGSPVGEDYVLGVYVKDQAHSIHGMLDGETGRIDCGFMSSWIISICTDNGIEWE